MEVSGRGELHLGILLEQLRREDFEFMVEAPTVVTVKNSEGQDTEPIERVKIEVDSKHSNAITEAFMNRNAEFVDMEELPGNITRLLFKITTRQMMGLKKYLVGLTKGEISMESEITGYELAEDLTRSRSTGVIVATHNGICSEYGLSHLEEKGVSFVLPGTKVYAGMIVGEIVGESELELNPAKEKRLTNIRSAGRDENIKLSPPKVFTIEEAFTYIQDDELVEITPKNIRIRKKELNPNLRRRDNKIRKQAGK
jgi:GTP-binding protein